LFYLFHNFNNKRSCTLKKILIASTLLLCSSFSQAGVILADGTLNSAGDLTRIDTEGSIFEFLDLTTTQGLTAASASATYAADGFEVASFANLVDLFDSFGFTGAVLPGLGGISFLSGGDVAGLGSHLGLTAGSWSIGTFDNGTGDLASFCFDTPSLCGADAVIGNFDVFNGAPNAGILMARTIGAPAAVPEPSAIALFSLGLFGLGLVRRRQRNTL
jgi:hypothetical protein